MATAIYPGTFDPITCGHIDLVERACKLFDRVVVAVAANSRKQPLFVLEERIDLCRETLDHLGNVEIKGFDNLLVDFARSQDSHIILRGVRAVSDFEYEFQLASTNRAMAPEFETLFLTPGEHLAFISSSLVREIAGMGGDVSRFVPTLVDVALREKFAAGG